VKTTKGARMKARLFVLLLAIGAIAGLLWVQLSEEPAARDVQPEPSAKPPDGLFGITYVLQPSTGFALVEGTAMEMSLSKGSEASDHPQDVFVIWFNAGCNSFHADFRLTSGVLESTDGYRMTEMGCERPLHEQDDWLAKFLVDGPALAVSGDHLTLTGDSATLSLLNKKVADPDRPLVGRVWTAKQYIQAGSLAWMSLEKYPTLSFSEEGALSIFDGCNQLEGRYTTLGSELTLTLMAPVTARQCTDDHRLSISAHYDQVFADGTLTHTIDANVLRIERGDNGVVAYTD